MINPNIERAVLDSGIEVVRTTETNIPSGVNKRIAVEYRDDARVTRYSADFYDAEHSYSGEVLVGASTGTSLVPRLARLDLAYGRSVEIAHGSEPSVINTALKMQEVYQDERFFSGISFTFQELEEIHLFHMVSGDKARYKGTLALGETLDHPSLWAPFPYRYTAQREGGNLAFSRTWLPDLSTWKVTMPEGLMHPVVADQIKGPNWKDTYKAIPVNLTIS